MPFLVWSFHYTQKTFACQITYRQSRRRRVYYPQLVAVYHQPVGLYIIKLQEDARWRVMRYSPKGADDIHDCVVMICQACGLDKKFDKSKLVEFFGRGRRTRTHDTQFWRLVFYRLNYTPIFCRQSTEQRYYITNFSLLQDLFEKKLFFLKREEQAPPLRGCNEASGST